MHFEDTRDNSVDLGVRATDMVTLVVRADNDHITFARLVATALAGRVGLTFDAIEDVRLGVSELCRAVIAAAAHDADLTIACQADDRGITVSGSVPIAPGAEVDGDELTEQVLRSVADQYTYGTGEKEATFMMFRRTTASAS